QIDRGIRAAKIYCKKCLSRYIYEITKNSNGVMNLDNKHQIDNNEHSIASGYIESTLTKRSVPILYLPWWDNETGCIVCSLKLKFMSDCQRYCTRCCIIYIGCRYCLTTNIIFGSADQSQCKKCDRISSINIDIINLSSGDHDLDDFLYDQKFKIYNNLQLDEIISNIKSDNQKEIYDFVKNKLLEPTIER